MLAEGEADQLVKDYRQLMEDGQRTIEPVLTDYKSKYAIDWSPFLGAVDRPGRHRRAAG